MFSIEAAVRWYQVRSSSTENTSSREYIRARWVTGAKASDTSPPTSWVGESLATISGCIASRSSSRRYRASYSASEISGASFW